MQYVTTKYDVFIKDLIRAKEIVWIVTLASGTKVYSDYNRDGMAPPWVRLVEHMNTTGDHAVKVEAFALGAPNTTVIEDANGLDGFFIKRGVIKDVVLENSDYEPLQSTRLICGLYDKSSEKIRVNIFNWPNNELFNNFETREVTEENMQHMYFIDKNLEKSIKEKLNG